VARLGRRTASRVLPWIYGAGFALLVGLVGVGYPPSVLLGLAALPPAVYASAKVWSRPEDFHREHPVQPAALLCFVLYSLGVGAGVLLDRG